MFWSFPWRQRLLDSGEAARRRHSSWLSAAVRSHAALPRIPVRPVSQGGFDPILAVPEGRAWAEGWWGKTLDRKELDIAG